MNATWSIITVQTYTLTQQLPAQRLPGILSYLLWDFHGLRLIAGFLSPSNLIVCQRYVKDFLEFTKFF